MHERWIQQSIIEKQEKEAREQRQFSNIFGIYALAAGATTALLFINGAAEAAIFGVATVVSGIGAWRLRTKSK